MSRDYDRRIPARARKRRARRRRHAQDRADQGDWPLKHEPARPARLEFLQGLALDLDPERSPVVADGEIRDFAGGLLDKPWNVSNSGVTRGSDASGTYWSFAADLNPFIASDQDEDGLVSGLVDGVPFANGAGPFTLYVVFRTGNDGEEELECPFAVYGAEENNYALVMVNNTQIQAWVHDGTTFRNANAGVNAAADTVYVAACEFREDGSVRCYVNGVGGTPTSGGGAPNFAGASAGFTALGFQPYAGRHFNGEVYRVIAKRSLMEADLSAYLQAAYRA